MRCGRPEKLRWLCSSWKIIGQRCNTFDIKESRLPNCTKKKSTGHNSLQRLAKPGRQIPEKSKDLHGSTEKLLPVRGTLDFSPASRPHPPGSIWICYFAAWSVFTPGRSFSACH